MRLAWGAHVSDAFRRRVIGIADALGADPSHLMACMAFETGRTFSPSVRNPASGATGLIQFMPMTARGLGTTTEELAAMTAEDQLRFVAAYFQPYTGKVATLEDCYAAILWPAAVGQPNGFVLFSEGSRAYEQNRGLDVNDDGNVTKAEACEHVRRILDEGLFSQNAVDVDDAQVIEPAKPYNPEQDGGPPPMMGGAMPQADLSGFAKAAIGIGSIFAGPFAPLVATLGNALVDAFSPAAKDAIAKGVGKLIPNHPEIGETVANIVVGAAQTLTGKDSPIEAVAEAMKDPAKMAQIETQAVDRISAMLPVFDKLAAQEQAAWKSSEDSVAAARSANAATVDVAWWKSQIFGITLLLLVPIDFVLGCVMLGVTNVASDTVSMVIGIVIGTGLGSIISYFYGTTRQSGSKDVLISQLAKGSKP